MKACTWLREISSCSCLNVLPGPAWLLLKNLHTLILGTVYGLIAYMVNFFAGPTTDHIFDIYCTLRRVLALALKRSNALQVLLPPSFPRAAHPPTATSSN